MMKLLPFSMTMSPKFMNPSLQWHTFDNGNQPFQRPLTKSLNFFISACLRPRRFNTRRRHHFRRSKISHPSSPPTTFDSSSESGKFEVILDIDTLRNTLNSFETKVNEFISSGTEAYKDLQTLVSIDERSNRVVISCGDTTSKFLSAVVLWSFVVVVVVQVFAHLVSGLLSGLGRMTKSKDVQVVRRRDRSLGGKEVVVAIGSEGSSRSRISSDSRSKNFENLTTNWRSPYLGRQEKKLPSWWPVLVSSPVTALNEEEGRREANRLIRAIVDARLRGEDISEADILKLRRTCRNTGAKVVIDTPNVRNSFYRAAVEFVINECSREASRLAQIDGEDARVFIAGLADNIGLPSIRAATMISASVAAHTRLWFLQAWALEMQDKHSEVVAELSKICSVLQMFPPEPDSPEMELVARGLANHLKLDQREFLWDSFTRLCGETGQVTLRAAAEALGLVRLVHDHSN